MSDDDTPEKVLRLWKKGHLGANEFRCRLIETATPATVKAFLKLVPHEILEQLRREIEQAPTTDEGWSNMRIVRSWCGPWNEEIAASVREEDEKSLKRYRAGVEALRQVFCNRDRPLNKL
jgi:hypothetical protein